MAALARNAATAATAATATAAAPRACRLAALLPTAARARSALAAAARMEPAEEACPQQPQLPQPAAPRRALLLAAASSAAAVASAAHPLAAHAGLDSYNVTGKDIMEVDVQLGGPDGELAFYPSTIELTAGRLTKLRLRNPSKLTHYFTALEFADKAYTVLVLSGDPAVEVKGKVQEVALKAGASATWVLVPIKPGTYPLKCTVKGHAEGGMAGSIVVRPAA